MTPVTSPPVADPAVSLQRRETIQRFFAALQDGDYAVLAEVLAADAITRWPQSGERITGAMACARVYENYPGGSPKFQVQRISGGGQAWIAESVADYGDQRWYPVSIFDFEGSKITRITDYFGPSLPAPAWRQEWVEREEGIA